MVWISHLTPMTNTDSADTILLGVGAQLPLRKGMRRIQTPPRGGFARASRAVVLTGSFGMCSQPVRE